MAADLHIHVFTGMTEDDLAAFRNNHMGSRHFGAVPYNQRRWDKACDRIAATPQVWVGEVSWLKSALFGDDSYVPDAIAGVSDIIGEDLPVVDDDLIARIAEALGRENTTPYEVADDEDVLAFLHKHQGERVFTVSW